MKGNTDLGPWIRRARSLVIFPVSTVSMHAVSSFKTKSSNFSCLSSLALQGIEQLKEVSEQKENLKNKSNRIVNDIKSVMK